MKKLVLLILGLILSVSIFAQELSQTFLSLNNTGVQEFLEKYPEYDGRGTVVIVLDTGVDPIVPGLDLLPDGSVKVIDLQDFTGQGDMPFYEAEIEELELNDTEDVKCFVNEEKSFRVGGADKITLKPIDDKYFIGVLPEKLWMNSRSGLNDLNENGEENDQYFFVTFKTSIDGVEKWVVYFDSNGDQDLSDEKAVTNYKDNPKENVLYVKNGTEVPLLGMGLNVRPDEKIVTFVFDDGAHGSHCAGIAGGNKISNELNGVAPGAKVIGLKIGHNNFSGGATVTESMKNAYLYAAELVDELDVKCVINMSYGIGSEIENHSDIENFFADFVPENPYLYICTSNGNEGPGISSAGLPSSSPYVLSSGAMLAKEVAADVYGAELEQDIVLYFSSRGGEVNKPDVISPGACTSTVPNWTGGDVMWGTSMASPYSTGVSALLLSAASQEFPDVKIPSRFLYKIIKDSAVPQKGYLQVDQGAGMINVVKAWELLKTSIENGELEKFETYKVSSFAPNMPNQKSENLYIRNGNYLNGTETFTFKVERENTIGKDKFYRTFKLESDSDWLKPLNKRTYLRNDQNAYVDVRLDKSILSKPGLYSGKIEAYRADKSKTPEFEMVANVVIPYNLNSNNNYRLEFNHKLKAAEYARHYVNIPFGATALKLKMNVDAGKYSFARLYIHDSDGKQISRTGILRSTDSDNELVKMMYNIKPGVYEIVAEAWYSARDVSEFELSIEIDGINKVSESAISENHKFVKVQNALEKIKTYNLSGSIDGYSKNYVKVINEEIVEIPFTLKPGVAEKTFEITLSKEDYNKVTDFAIMIVDKEGKIYSRSGLSYSETSISVSNDFGDVPKELILQLIPGYANAPSNIAVHINEISDFANKTTVVVKANGNSRATFYPGVKTDLDLDYDKPAYEIPEGSKIIGEILFENNSNKNTEYILPVEFKF